MKSRDISKINAYKFILLIGMVSFFADFTYEGARSITGPYLAALGANALTVGFVAGLGELIGYSIRFASGYLLDKTERYWTITIIGYFLNLISVPLLAIVGNWEMAALLIIMERLGKAIRIPARDAMLSHAGHRLGAGWAFGLHEALDRAGAMVGPLVIALMLYHHQGYPKSFAFLGIPALFALGILIWASFLYPRPRALESQNVPLKTQGLNSTFWLYLIGASLIAAGFADFSLIAYHFSKSSILTDGLIPLSYALAMGVSALTAPLLGYLYDRTGFFILIGITIISIAFSPLVFLGGTTMAFVGVVLWSLGMGANESLMRAIIANMISLNKRGSAYGIFNMGYGIAWFLGSVILGFLYDTSLLALVTFSVVIQLSAIPIFWVVMKKIK